MKKKNHICETYYSEFFFRNSTIQRPSANILFVNFIFQYFVAWKNWSYLKGAK